ncbi:family 43 glycosylhydrolase [Metabacillus malikii]|uniref:GH43 family beta-xylosidase n=1 Tax=Metabacillus malikii TaxID=1504265 RepID=A0ABT9ZIY7_9BACI|nr:family 43 glycosylhydrolase [Metabacillus malikii]MDQ0231200.1 GH43 family beta-xylosidase [Metabacillus malikii]
MIKLKKYLSLLVIFVVFVSILPTGYPQISHAETKEIDDEILLWYPFTDAETTNVIKDASGHGHDGKLVNDAKITMTEKGGAVELDGNQDYVELPANILDGLTDVTISSWVHLDELKDWASLYSFGNFKGNESNFTVLNFAPKGGTNASVLELITGNFTTFHTAESPVLKEQEWVHVTTVLSGKEKTMSTYLNGVLQKTIDFPMNVNDINSAQNYIGWAQFPWEQEEGKGLNGKVADFRIYSKALSKAEIRNLAEVELVIESVEVTNIITVRGKQPKLPATVSAQFADGTKEHVQVEWDEVTEQMLKNPGELTIHGTIEGTAIKAIANIMITEENTITSLETVTLSTVEGELPKLPTHVLATYLDKSTEEVAVNWEKIDREELNRVGTMLTVQGTVENTELRAQAKIYVTSKLSGELVTWYKFDSIEGKIVSDLSGNQQNAQVNNGATISETQTKSGIDLKASDKQYVTLPKGIASGLNDFTLTTWVYLNSKTGDWARIFDFGNGANASKMFLTPNLRLDMDGSILTATSGLPKVGEWTHLAISKTGDQYRLYSNGIEVGKMSAATKPEDYGDTPHNFIGRSNYAADPYLDGKISDFRIYNRGLTEDEVGKVIAESYTDAEAVAKAKESLEIGDTTNVIANIDLPTAATNGVAVKWESSNENIVSAGGKVTRPKKHEQDTTVTLTASLTKNGYTDTKEFQVTVLADNIISIKEIDVMTPLYFPPKLPNVVEVQRADGTNKEMKVSWEKVDEKKLSKYGTVKVKGSVYATKLKAVANVHIAELEKIEDVHVTTKIGQQPELPATVTAHYSNGLTGELNVNWNKIAKADYTKKGTFTVDGVATNYSYSNPLIEQRADPHIYKHTDGYYYYTASVPEYNRIILRRAKTIQGLATAEEVVIWEKHSTGEMAAHIWAPEIHFIDGKWYIYFAAGSSDDIWNIRPYVLETEDKNPLTGTWNEKGMIQKDESDTFSFTDFSLDATTFENNGKRYLVWAQKQAGISNLYIAEMENAWTIKGKPVMISTPDYDWERQGFWVNEGAAIIKRNGKIFMTYSASATDANYAVGLLAADETSDLLNPKSWNKSTQPIFKSNEETSQYGPGHNSFTVAEDGVTDLFVYHARSYKEIDGDPLYDPNRHTRVKAITWNQDGTPELGISHEDGDTQGVSINVKAHVTVMDNSLYTVETIFNQKKLQANKDLNANIRVVNHGNEEEELIGVIALYNEKNQLVSNNTVTKRALPNQETIFDVNLMLPEKLSGHKVKVFVWKGSSIDNTTMEPIANVSEMTEQGSKK